MLKAKEKKLIKSLLTQLSSTGEMPLAFYLDNSPENAKLIDKLGEESGRLNMLNKTTSKLCCKTTSLLNYFSEVI